MELYVWLFMPSFFVILKNWEKKPTISLIKAIIHKPRFNFKLCNCKIPFICWLNYQIDCKELASFHTFSFDSLTADELRTKRKLEKPIAVITANRKVHIEYEADVFLEKLGIPVTVRLLPNTMNYF